MLHSFNDKKVQYILFFGQLIRGDEKSSPMCIKHRNTTHYPCCAFKGNTDVENVSVLYIWEHMLKKIIYNFGHESKFEQITCKSKGNMQR